MKSFNQSIWKGTSEGRKYDSLERDIEVDVTVVGGGITGLTTALLLKEAGKKVVVLEAKQIGSGNTGNTTAHLSSFPDEGYAEIEKLFGVEGAKTLCRAMNEGIDLVERIVNEYSIDCSFGRVPGYYYTEDDAQDVKEQFEASRSAGLDVEFLKNIPLPFPVQVGFEVKRQAQFHSLRYLNRLAELINDGERGRVYENSRVNRFEEDGQNGLECEVEVENGAVIRSRAVVLATHTPLGRSILHTMLPPYHSYAMALRLENHESPHGLFWDNAEPYHYIRTQNTSEGPLVLVGGKDHKAGQGDERESFEALERYARLHFQVAEVRYRWSSQYYIPADHLPMIGRNLFSSHIDVATGFSGDGISFGSLSAWMISQQILGEATPYDEFLAPGRIRRRGISRFLRENLEVVKDFVGDRIPVRAEPSILQLQAGEGCIYKKGYSQYAIFRDQNEEYHAYSAVCPHMKCIVRWNEAQKSFDCPCHGSRFDESGKVMEGPSLQGLRAISEEEFAAFIESEEEAEREAEKDELEVSGKEESEDRERGKRAAS